MPNCGKFHGRKKAASAQPCRRAAGDRVCLSNTRGAPRRAVRMSGREGGVISVKKFALPLAAMLALLSIAGCAQYYGKGKAPPPVVTKG